MVWSWFYYWPTDFKCNKKISLTDLDTESYYIVEGVLRKENPFEDDELGNRVKRKGGGGGKSWYRIGDA